MAFGSRPVASLRKRASYKTEFDIFKQNTDIELISLVSYDENDPCHLEEKSSKLNTKSTDHPRIIYNSFNNTYSRTNTRHDRDFRSNIWNKGDTSIYKAFARTSKTFLRNRTYGRTLERSRTCYSATDFRKPSTEAATKTRCQSTCGNRTSERYWNKGAKLNKPDNASSETKENVINRTVNKQSVSTTNRPLWRTKSAPISSQQSYQNSRRSTDRPGYLSREKSARVLTTRSGKSDSDINTSIKARVAVQYRTSVYSERDTCRNSTRVNRNQDTKPGEDTVENTEEYSDIRTVKGNSTNEDRDPNDRVTERDTNSDKQLCHHDDSSEKCLSVKNGVSLDCESNANSNANDLVNATNDSPESKDKDKDSGFASNTVTPELETQTVTTEGGEQFDSSASRKRVKFACAGDDSASNVDACSVESEDGLSDKISVSSDGIEEEESTDTTAYDVNTLINDLERFGANSRLSVISAGCHSNYSHEDSLCGENVSKLVKESTTVTEEDTTGKEEDEGSQQLNSTVSDLESLNMSKEARHAILETLQDMGVKKTERRNKENFDFRDIKHRSVNVQRKQTDNRHKYEFYMRERTRSFYKQQFKSMDSVGNEDNSSNYSSPSNNNNNNKDADDSASDDVGLKGKLFPTIQEMKPPGVASVKRSSNQPKQIVTLENVRHRKHKIPGIGNFHMIASPDNDFEITPAGFDSRYNRPIISKEEMEIPPRFIRERSIQKCKNWLKRNVSLSPLALQPVKKS